MGASEKVAAAFHPGHPAPAVDAMLRNLHGMQGLRNLHDIDRATANLLALLGPSVGPSVVVDAVTDEVERRTRLFADLRTASPRAGQHPRLAALQSVTADVLAGRFA